MVFRSEILRYVYAFLVSVVLLVGLDKRHSLYRVTYWNTTETLSYIMVFVGILELFMS